METLICGWGGQQRRQHHTQAQQWDTRARGNQVMDRMGGMVRRERGQRSSSSKSEWSRGREGFEKGGRVRTIHSCQMRGFNKAAKTSMTYKQREKAQATCKTTE